MTSLTTTQKLGISIAMLGFIAGSATQLTDIFAPFGSIAPLIVKEIVTISGFVSGVLGIVLSFISGQANVVKAVQAMPGVESIIVNKDASQALAQLAVDPVQAKIDIAPGATAAVTQTAKGTP